MKTASTSQAWVLTVASRQSSTDEFVIRQWNIPWLNDVTLNPEGKWHPLIPSTQFIPRELFDLLESSRGTIVLWTDLSKMIPNIGDLTQANLTQALSARVKRCREHLELVFHRFIEGNCAFFQDPIEFFLNGVPLQANDPFQSNHRAHRQHQFNFEDSITPEHQIPSEDNETISLALRRKVMQVNGHIIPRTDELHDEIMPDGSIRTANDVQTRRSRKNLNQNQGIYFYRLDRLIQAGGWSRAYASEPHYSLARVALQVDRTWDDEIQLNVNKTRILDQIHRDDLNILFSQVRSHAEKMFTVWRMGRNLA